MSKKEEDKKEVDKKDGEEEVVAPKEIDYCFVIMPISDPEGYDTGHFTRVYNYIIKPACLKAGLIPIRADDVTGTNMIVIDMLQKIITSKMAVCDLSGRNPNVLYELGIRQSFDLPVTLMKDEVTERIFDIQGFRAVDYKKSLRFDEVVDAVDALTKSLKETLANKGKDVNSIIELLGISKASLKEPVKISGETEVILNAIKDVSRRVARLESPSSASGDLTNHSNVGLKRMPISAVDTDLSSKYGDILPGGEIARLRDSSLITKNSRVNSTAWGKGEVVDIIDTSSRNGSKSIIIKFDNGVMREFQSDSPDLEADQDNLLSMLLT